MAKTADKTTEPVFTPSNVHARTRAAFRAESNRILSQVEFTQDAFVVYDKNIGTDAMEPIGVYLPASVIQALGLELPTAPAAPQRGRKAQTPAE